MKKFLLLFVVILLILWMLPGQNFAATGTVVQLRPVTAHTVSGIPMLGISRPMWTDAIVLVANTAQSYTIPTGATYILFSASSGCDFYVNYTTTAAVPGASTSTGLVSEMNPGLRALNGATSISLISATAGIITVSLFK